MTSFGDTLRKYRQASNDPGRMNRRLTQERLGELIGEELGDLGVSGAAISEWELGKSRISAADRRVLISLVCVLNRCGSLKTIAEAEQLLNLGGYSAPDADETRHIFPDSPNDADPPPLVSGAKIPETNRQFWLADMFSIPQAELNELFSKAREGPEPVWPRVLAAFLRKASERFSLSITVILWVVVWLLTLWLTSPSLRFPFATYNSAFIALVMYAGGSLILPLLIGMIVNTKDSEYWKRQDRVNPILLRLYTYQGAGIGFNIGYFLVFPLSLARYYLGFGSSVWIEIIAATVSVILGNMGAHVVPHNLWIAYGRLKFRDGGIFFVVALMGPLWAFFFLEYYSTLLHPALGIIVILLALSAVVLFARKSSKKQPA